MKTLVVSHECFGDTMGYSEWHLGINHATSQMSLRGKLYFLYLLLLCRWTLVDYNLDGLVLTKK